MKRAQVNDEAMARSMPASLRSDLEDGDSASGEAARVTIYMHEQLRHRLRKYALSRSLTVSTVAKLALEEYMANHPPR